MKCHDNLFVQRKLNVTNYVKKNGFNVEGYSYPTGMFLSGRIDMNQMFTYL